MLTATDFYCGMGGSSTGLVSAGFEVKLAANHWDRAIETHSANHPGTEHLQADLTGVDMRYLPRTRALWASPICTELSPAGGRQRRQPDLFQEYGHVPDAAFERTRVTFWEVIRAAEIHRYEVVMLENVAEAASWELFDVWLAGMARLGYLAQFVSVSAAHVAGGGIGQAPQWRDRMYIVLRREGMRPFDLEPRPLARCEKCGTDVEALQWWKRDGRRIGKYRQQYHYVCPVGNHGIVEPYVTGAAKAIDWSDPGTRIGDRPRPLAAATMRRIRDGIALLPADQPVPPLVTVLRRNGTTTPAATEPAATFTGGGFHHGLVIPFRRGSKPHPPTEPLSTMATREAHGVLRANLNIEDAYFRMLKPREAANAQAFPGDYIIRGNQGEQQMQAGNAVAVNVAAWIGERVAAGLGGAP